MISTPKLPPLPGYVEATIGENHVYVNVKTGLLMGYVPEGAASDEPEAISYEEMATAYKEGVQEA